MSKRLQVILDDEELAEIQRAAKRSRMTSSEWVRQALRKARRAEPHGDLKKKSASCDALPNTPSRPRTLTTCWLRLSADISTK